VISAKNSGKQRKKAAVSLFFREPDPSWPRISATNSRSAAVIFWKNSEIQLAASVGARHSVKKSREDLPLQLFSEKSGELRSVSLELEDFVLDAEFLTLQVVDRALVG